MNSALINNQNIDIYADSRRSQNIAWYFADDLISEFAHLKSEPTEVVSPDIINLIQSHVTYNYWSEYFSRNLHRKFYFLDSVSSVKFDSYLTIDILDVDGTKAFVVALVKPSLSSMKVQSVCVFDQNDKIQPQKFISRGFIHITDKRIDFYKLDRKALLSNFTNRREVEIFLRSVVL